MYYWLQSVGIAGKTVQADSVRGSISGVGLLAESERLDEESLAIGRYDRNRVCLRLSILSFDRLLWQCGR